VAAALEFAAKAVGLEPELLRAVAYVESRFNPLARSPKGAQGLLQLMPVTAQAMGVSDPFDPAQNAIGGAKYLAHLVRKYGGDTERALAAYNWGPGNVDGTSDDEESTLPNQVRGYVAKVLERWHLERGDRGIQPGRPPPAPRSHFFACSCGRRLELREVPP
jgi:soluble lytic murein transglycosylase-like protein